MRRVGAMLCLAMLGAGAFAGCGGGDEASEDPPKAAAEPYSVEDALRDLPLVRAKRGEHLRVFSGDMAKAAKLAGAPEPTDDESTSAWVAEITSPPMTRVWPEELGLRRKKVGAMRKALGFDLRDSHGVATVSTESKQLTTLALNDGAALKKGVTTSGHGEVGALDPSDLDDAAFPAIQGLAQQKDRVAYTKTAALLTAWTERDATSLADDKALLEVAKALDSHDIYGAVLCDRPVAPPRFASELVDSSGGLKMPEFDAVGIGQGVEGGKAVEYIAYRFDDAASARDRVEEFWRDDVTFKSGRLMAEIFEVEDVSVRGNIVTVTAYPKESPSEAMNLLSNGDVPFTFIK